MRITKVSVKKLFGMFDHDIPLNQDSRITIIHGPNGIGKTVLLNMIHGLFHYDYELIRRTPFEQFCVEFENGESITVEKSEDDNNLLIQFCDDTDSIHPPFQPEALQPDDLNEFVESVLPHLRRIEREGKSYWADKIVDEYVSGGLVPLEGYYSTENIFSHYPQLHTYLYGETPEWFMHTLKETRTKSIHTERLRSEFFYDSPLHTLIDRYETDDIYMSNPPAVRLLSHIFELAVQDYFPLEEFEKLEKLNELAEAEAEIEIDSILDASMANTRLSERREELELMRQEIENKYQDVNYFQEVLLFQDIINERFLFKSLELGYGEFKFTADDGSDVPLSALSSGEQHLLVLYCELFDFWEIEPATLVMIDEPELSMNIVWQRRFLNDLQRIIKLRKFDVLIATHSPQIIHDKWDWMVALSEPESD